jgi:hypothetical protein
MGDEEPNGKGAVWPLQNTGGQDDEKQGSRGQAERLRNTEAQGFQSQWDKRLVRTAKGWQP